MKTAIDIVVVIATIIWFPLCMAWPFVLTAHGVNEKDHIKYGITLSYPIFIFFLYWLFEASVFSIAGLTLLKWSLVIAGIPVFLILFNAVKSLAKSTCENIVLFSPLEGVLTFEGNPAAGAKITRRLTFNENVSITDTFYANEQGEFNISTKNEIIRITPMRPLAIQQIINVEYDNNNFSIWRMNKFNKVLYGELGGKPIGVKCELTDPHSDINVTEGYLHTSCKWSSVTT